MSSPESDEVNQILRNVKKVSHQVCGEAIGMISDTQTTLLTQLGQELLRAKIQISNLQKELDKSKEKKPSK